MKKDLVILVADLDMEQALKGLLSRQPSLGSGPFTYDIFRHPQKDPGCFNDAHHFLRSQSQLYDYAIIMFDFEGSGQEQKDIKTLQEDLEIRLSKNGWQDRSCVIVIAPELEVWIWSDSPQVDACLGWGNQQPNLRTWLKLQGHIKENAKPNNPKLTLEVSLQKVGKRPSASIFRHLGEKVSINRCTDPSFQRLLNTLKKWFH